MVAQTQKLIIMEDFISTKNGYKLMAKHIKTYSKGILWFCQERLVITDLQHNEISSNDIIDLVEEIL